NSIALLAKALPHCQQVSSASTLNREAKRQSAAIGDRLTCCLDSALHQEDRRPPFNAATIRSEEGCSKTRHSTASALGQFCLAVYKPVSSAGAEPVGSRSHKRRPLISRRAQIATTRNKPKGPDDRRHVRQVKTSHAAFGASLLLAGAAVAASAGTR